MDEIDVKALLDDARGRDAAWLALMLATDRQAMDLFRIYVTLGSAIASALAAGLHNNMFGQEAYPIVAILLLLGCLIAGSACCMIAMKPMTIGLPGRPAKFWLSALESPEADKSAIMTGYLKQAAESQRMNSQVNSQNSSDLAMAKKLGMLGFASASTILLLGWQST